MTGAQIAARATRNAVIPSSNGKDRAFAGFFRALMYGAVGLTILALATLLYDVAKETLAGSGSTFAAGTTRYSASVPGRCSPRIAYLRHSGLSPVRQYSHVRSLTPGFTMTRSPARTEVTLAPMASTTPEQYEPRIHPGVMRTPGTPFTTQRSRWLSAAAHTRTRTSSGAETSGVGASVRKRS